MRALIGYTGFVGSNLLREGNYDAAFNSRNFGDLAGRHFDEVVCAGVPAAKWIANQQPETDQAAIAALTSVLEQASIRRFVLISTIDVYPDPALGIDEAADLSGQHNHAYGAHRYALERWVQAHYADFLIARLPALFGPGMKKNALYDLLHCNQIEKINPASIFQWYPVERLSSDVATAMLSGLKLVNLFTAPVAMSTIISRHFETARVGQEMRPAPIYALRTRYAELFGGRDGYIMSEEEELRAIADFVEGEQGKR